MSRRSICFASSRRRFPNTSHTTLFLSAAKSRRSPGSPAIAVTSPFISSSVINLAKDDFRLPSSLMHTYASPFAPKSLAKSTSLSIFLRGMDPCPLALIPRTDPPFSIAPVNTPKPQFFTTSVTSCNSMPKRVSGLSEPKRSIASCQVIRWIGSCTSTSISLNMRCSSLSFTSITSSTSTKDNSISIWVNSG